MKQISKLHFITTSATVAEQACAGGVDWVQLRLKNVSYDEYRKVALEVQEICKRYNARLIINDVPRLALEIGADGVHVGKEDTITEEEEKALLTGGYIIGRTTNTLEDILNMKDKPTDYIGLGPYRFTTTKDKLSPVLGAEGYKQIYTALSRDGYNAPPIIGIGGITAADIPELMSTGLYGIAVSGAIANSTNVRNTAEQFRMLINNSTESSTSPAQR